MGGTSADQLIGQQDHDALYGEGGHDRIDGQNGDDLVIGGVGEDTLIGGPGTDKIDARDGRKDTIAIRLGEGDVVYYDRGLDVLEASASQSTTDDGAGLSVAEAIATGKVRLLAEAPPEGLFGHTGKVLVEHGGEELLVAENKVATHVGHGDEVLDPTGRSGAEEGRN